MDFVMTSDRKDKYFEKYLDGQFGAVTEDIRELKDGLKANTHLTQMTKDQAERTNGRVSKLEEEVFGQVSAKDTTPWWRDAKVLQVLGWLSLAFLLLVAAATRFDVEAIL